MSLSMDDSEAMTSLSTSTSSSTLLSSVIERTASVTKTLTHSVSLAIASGAAEEVDAHMCTPHARKHLCSGMYGEAHRKCLTANGPHKCQGMQGYVQHAWASSSLDDTLRNNTRASWMIFVVLFTALLFLSLLTAALVCHCLRSRQSPREDYEELADVGGTTTVGVADFNGNTSAAGRPDGNASRQRFLQSRRAAAQRSYGGTGASTE